METNALDHKVELQKIAKPAGVPHIQLYRCEDGHIYVRCQAVSPYANYKALPAYRAIKIYENGDIEFKGSLYWADQVILSEKIALS